MEFNLISQNENPLFGRKEITATVISVTSPGKEEVRELISKEIKSNKDLIKIKKIDGSFGSGKFVVTANIYPSKDALESIEFKSKKEIEAEKKAEEARKAAEEEAKKTTEAPAEEKTENVEEVKTEEKME